MRADLAIKGGTVISTGRRSPAHVYVADGRITHVSDENLPADDVVDATDLFVLPGMVDTHVHLMDPGETDREDFPTGTAAAAAAGVTSIVEHTHSRPVRSRHDLDLKLRYLDGRSNVDYGLAAHTWPDRIDEMPALWEGGIAFFKIFTCTTHGVPGLVGTDLERALAMVASLGGACLIHCEDEEITRSAESALRARGREDNGILLEWRTREAEETAVAEACRVATSTGARVTFAHVSSPAAAGIVSRARVSGADVAAETCPQYLALREEEVLTEGAFRKFTPPARARTDEDENEMWLLLRSGVFNHVSTDHAPSTGAHKAAGIWEAPFGLPGLDTTAPFLIDAALNGRITLEDVARVYAEAPARRYGLYPRKGIIAVGSDADLVLVDESSAWVVSDPEIISKAGWSPFAGRTWRGAVVATYLRGQLIAEARSPRGSLSGRFLAGPGRRSA